MRSLSDLAVYSLGFGERVPIGLNLLAKPGELRNGIC
jgi:hypothetical protein